MTVSGGGLTYSNAGKAYPSTTLTPVTYTVNTGGTLTLDNNIGTNLADRLGKEGFLLRSDGKNLFVIGKEAAGVQHGVTTLLQSLGCRWFFPGKTWEIVPERKTISGSWDTRQTPDFPFEVIFADDCSDDDSGS